MCAVRFVLRVVAFAAVIFPEATAASISLVLAATSAAISAAVLLPAIVASESPACRRVLRVAISIPMVEVIKVSFADRSGLATPFRPCHVQMQFLQFLM